jgi:hypothetical protein
MPSVVGLISMAETQPTVYEGISPEDMISLIREVYEESGLNFVGERKDGEAVLFRGGVILTFNFSRMTLIETEPYTLEKRVLWVEREGVKACAPCIIIDGPRMYSAEPSRQKPSDSFNAAFRRLTLDKQLQKRIYQYIIPASTCRWRTAL